MVLHEKGIHTLERHKYQFADIIRKFAKEQLVARPGSNTVKKAPYVSPMERTQVAKQLMSTWRWAKNEDEKHAHLAAALFLIIANSSGQRLADFAHARWGDFTIRYSAEHDVDLLIIKPETRKQDVLGKKPDQFAMISVANGNEWMCPVKMFKFCEANMNANTFGPFWVWIENFILRIRQ